MDIKTREMVRKRAGNCCEFCQLPQMHSPVAWLQIEHIVPKKHGGGDEQENLALACIDCNLAKSSNLSGIDSQSGNVVELFHPRRQRWRDHFEIRGATIVGLTPTGRATVAVLNMNHEERRTVRLVLKR